MLPDRPISNARAIDLAPLRHLLAISSMADGKRMITAFVNDLQMTQANLALAWNGPDFAALRTNSHVLIALSGTIGDRDLQALAQNLNALAQTPNVADLLDIRSETMTKTADLIEELLGIQNSAGT